MQQVHIIEDDAQHWRAREWERARLAKDAATHDAQRVAESPVYALQWAALMHDGTGTRHSVKWGLCARVQFYQLCPAVDGDIVGFH